MEANIRTSSRHALEERHLARQLAQPAAFKPFHVRALWGFEARMPEELWISPRRHHNSCRTYRRRLVEKASFEIRLGLSLRTTSRRCKFCGTRTAGNSNNLHPGNADARRFTASPFLPRQSQKKRLAHLRVPVFLWCQHFSCVAHFSVSAFSVSSFGASGARVALASALPWCQHCSGVSNSLVSAFLRS